MEATVKGDDPYYSYLLSRQAWIQRNFREALVQLERAAGADPGAVVLAVEIAQLYLDFNEPESAARSAERAVVLDPESTDGWRVLSAARVTLARGEATPERDAKAREALMGLLARSPSESAAMIELARSDMARGDLDSAMNWLRRHRAAAPDSEEGTIMAAQTLIRMEKAGEAVSTILDSIVRRPESPALRLALVEAHEANDDLEEALLVASRLEAAGVDPLRASYVLARLSRMAGKHADAYEHWTRIGAVLDARETPLPDADRAEVMSRRVESLLDMGNAEGAAALAAEGELRHATDKRFLMRHAEALLMLGRDETAAQSLSPALGAGADPSLKKMVSDVYLSAGARRERLKDWRRAEQLLRKSIETNNVNAQALNYLGYMFADRGFRLDEAVSLIRRALEQEPDNGAYLDSLGWVLFRRKEYEQAEVSLLKALKVLEDEPAVHQHLGAVYLATGRPGLAIDSLQKALNGGGDDPEGIRALLSAARKAAGKAP